MYDILEHKHRFASWAASTAASSSPIQRFKVESGLQILTKSGIMELTASIDHLPEPNHFDKAHRELRDRIILLAVEDGLKFTHGIAAKLINCYLKTVFTIGEHFDHPKVKAIHPPIDAVLLKALSEHDVEERKKFWYQAQLDRWSKFGSIQYEDVIEKIKELMLGQALWKVETYWQGYQH